MNRRLLSYYNRELSYLRELGGEFARQFPKIAGRLGLDSFECADPYVERLLEGFAFLAARVQLKIDAEFPRFTENLLRNGVPALFGSHPVDGGRRAQAEPSARVAHQRFSRTEGHVASQSHAARIEQTACEYRTAHDVTLWPIELTGVTHSAYVGDIGEIKTHNRRAIKGALRFGSGSLRGSRSASSR